MNSRLRVTDRMAPSVASPLWRRIFILGIDNPYCRKHYSVMDRIRFCQRFFVFFFCLHFASFIMLPLVCLSGDISPPGADSCCRSSLPCQTNHSSPAAKNKLPCSNNHSCCNFITSNAPNYFFTLYYFRLTPLESFSQYSNITTSVFRPPEAKI